MSVECWNSLEFQRIYPNTYRVIRQVKKRRHSILNFGCLKSFLPFYAWIVTTAVHTAPGPALLHSHTSYTIHQHPVPWLYFFFFFEKISMLYACTSLLAFQCLYLIFYILRAIHDWHDYNFHAFHNDDNNLVYILFAFTSFYTLFELGFLVLGLSAAEKLKRRLFSFSIIVRHSDGTKWYEILAPIAFHFMLCWILIWKIVAFSVLCTATIIMTYKCFQSSFIFHLSLCKWFSRHSDCISWKTAERKTIGRRFAPCIHWACTFLNIFFFLILKSFVIRNSSHSGTSPDWNNNEMYQ